MLSDSFVFWLLFQMVCERSEVFASACALARAFPLFTHRSSASRRTEKKTVTVEFFLVGQNNGPIEVATLKVRVWGFLSSAVSIIPWNCGFFFNLLHAQIHLSQATCGIGVVSKAINYPRSKFLEIYQFTAPVSRSIGTYYCSKGLQNFSFLVFIIDANSVFLAFSITLPSACGFLACFYLG